MKQLFFALVFSALAHTALVLAEDIKIPIGTQTSESKQIARPATETMSE